MQSRWLTLCAFWKTKILISCGTTTAWTKFNWGVSLAFLRSSHITVFFEPVMSCCFTKFSKTWQLPQIWYSQLVIISVKSHALSWILYSRRLFDYLLHEVSPYFYGREVVDNHTGSLSDWPFPVAVRRWSLIHNRARQPGRVYFGEDRFVRSLSRPPRPLYTIL